MVCFLMRVGVRAQVLIFGRARPASDFVALVDQPSGGGVDGQLQIGDRPASAGFSRRMSTDICVSGSPAPRPDAWCGSAARRATARLEAASGNWNRCETTVLAPVLLDGFDLGARHAAGDLGELHRERAAESAALLGDVHFAQFEAAHLGEQPARTVLDARIRAARGSCRDR